MLRILDFLFFSFICLLALLGNLPGSQQVRLQRQVYQASFMLAMCLYFVLFALGVSAARLSDFLVRQSWLSAVFLALTFMGFVLAFPVWYNRNHRALLVLQQYAPLVEKNKTLFPFAAAVFFGASFMLLVAALHPYFF